MEKRSREEAGLGISVTEILLQFYIFFCDCSRQNKFLTDSLH